MVAAASTPAPATASELIVEERRVLLYDVPWSTYVVLRDSLDQSGGRHVRLTYLEGRLEIMSPLSAEHEVNKKLIGRMLELLCLERGIPLYGYGSMTQRREEKKRALESDECYARGSDKATPDIALEVIVSSPLLDKLEVYRGLGVREVWVFRQGKFTVHALRSDAYEVIPTSEISPEVDLELLARHVAMPDQHAALLAYRDAIRQMK